MQMRERVSQPGGGACLGVQGPDFQKTLGQTYEKLGMNLHKTYDQRNKKNAIPPK